MKALLLLTSLFNFVTLSITNDYLTPEQKFYDIVNANYESYVSTNHNNAAGDLITTIGMVNNELSFSIYFANSRANFYSVVIVVTTSNKVKKYQLSSSEDYQMFFKIPIKDNAKYEVSLVANKTAEPYYIGSIADQITTTKYRELSTTKGLGNNAFPYETKLRNNLSTIAIVIIIGLCVITLELAIIFMVSKRKRKQRIQQLAFVKQSENVIYEVEAADYTVEKEDEDEDRRVY